MLDPDASPAKPERWATLRGVWPRIRWFNVAVLVLTPAAGIYGAFYTPLHRSTLLFSAFYYFFSMLGITAGYHRLFSHRSYTASVPLRLTLLLAGASAVQGSCLWWARTHRVHHRYTDTPKDPYAITKGVLYAHVGWVLIEKGRDEPRGRAEESDLKEDGMVRWQHEWYFPIALLMGYILPAILPGVSWGDWKGGVVYASLIRLTFVHHCTFLVNSLAHTLGEQSYDAEKTPRDSLLTAILTLGEGYHNFHHAFPADFRAAVHRGAFDPTQWFILCCSHLGLASRLQRTPSHAIEKASLHTALVALKSTQDSLSWPPPLSSLPVWSWDEYKKKTKEGPNLLLIGSAVHDATSFPSDHPGGSAAILRASGMDATTLFEAGTHAHSQAARDMLSMMRVAVLEGTENSHGGVERCAPPGPRVVVVDAQSVGRG